MYGVVIGIDDETFDAKVFDMCGDARTCFNVFKKYVGKGGFRSISIYEVPDAANALEASDAIKRQDSKQIVLLELKILTNAQWIEFPDHQAFRQLVAQYWGELNAVING